MKSNKVKQNQFILLLSHLHFHLYLTPPVLPSSPASAHSPVLPPHLSHLSYLTTCLTCLTSLIFLNSLSSLTIPTTQPLLPLLVSCLLSLTRLTSPISCHCSEFSTVLHDSMVKRLTAGSEGSAEDNGAVICLWVG